MYIYSRLSAIFLCEFSLQLRRRNKPLIEETAHIQTLSWSFQKAQTILRRAHDTITAELGELNTASFDSLEMDDINGENTDAGMTYAENRGTVGEVNDVECRAMSPTE